jgi:hypothetical protein
MGMGGGMVSLKEEVMGKQGSFPGGSNETTGSSRDGSMILPSHLADGGYLTTICSLQGMELGARRETQEQCEGRTDTECLFGKSPIPLNWGFVYLGLSRSDVG